MAIEIGIELFIELQSVSRVPAVKANPWLGNVLSAKAVGKFSWGFWWLCLWFQVFGAFGMRRNGDWDAGSSANPRSAKRSAPGHWWSGGDHTQAGGGNSDVWRSSGGGISAASGSGGRGGTARTPRVTRGVGTVGSSDSSLPHDSMGNGAGGIGPSDPLDEMGEAAEGLGSQLGDPEDVALELEGFPKRKRGQTRSRQSTRGKLCHSLGRLPTWGRVGNAPARELGLVNCNL